MTGDGKRFSAIVAAIGGGAFDEQLTEEMRKLIDGVTRSAKAGTLTLTFSVAPNKVRGTSVDLILTARSRLKAPPSPAPDTEHRWIITYDGDEQTTIPLEGTHE